MAITEVSHIAFSTRTSSQTCRLNLDLLYPGLVFELLTFLTKDCKFVLVFLKKKNVFTNYLVLILFLLIFCKAYIATVQFFLFKNSLHSDFYDKALFWTFHWLSVDSSFLITCLWASVVFFFHTQ